MRFVRLAVLVTALALAAAAPAAAHGPGVGHRVEDLVVPGSAAGENRQVLVHLWYPAEPLASWWAPRTVYTSRLHGRSLAPAPLDPVGWTVDAELARETRAIARHGRPLPVIVFSHGATNDPIDYAHTLERIAAAGFVVAAPYHVNNTQDDVRIDQANAAGARLPCFDDRPGVTTCARTDIPRSMQDRVRDIGAILDALPRWFGSRVDASRAGVMGHSRGSATALAAAGGSTAWGFEADARVKAVMGLAIAVRAINQQIDLADVTVPTVLVAGGLDQNSLPEFSREAFAAIGSVDKLFVGIPNATHRSFDSTYCAQLQSAGGNVLRDPARALLDMNTVRLVATSPVSGKAVHYCAERFFTRPADIRPLVASIPGSEFPPVVGAPSICVTATAPCTGLETDEVKAGVAAIAATFFDATLRRERIVYAGPLSPKWLMRHVRMVGSAEAFAGPDSICPPGQGVVCSS